MDGSGEMETVVSELIINVKTINNETHCIEILSNNTVHHLKEKIEEVTGIEVDRQRLIYRGRVLVDEDTIISYNIESEHIVHMVAKPANYRELQRQASSSSSSSPAVPSVSRSNIATTTGSSSFPVNINNLQNATLLGGIPSPAIFQLSNVTGAGTIAGQPPASVRQAMLESIARMQGGTTGGIAGGAINVNRQAAATDLQQENTRFTNQDAQLENIRQGMLTVNTLFSMNSEYSSQHPPENIYEPDTTTADLPPWRRFYIGQWIDVKDTVQQWLEATIMAVDERRRSVFVHYNGWPHRWDEWIRWDSPRIAPFRSRTTHSVLTGAACPTPNVIPPHAQRTGVSDVRTVIPELVRLYQSLQPMMTALSESVNDDLQHRPLTGSTDNVAQGMPWQQYHPIPAQSTSVQDQDDTIAVTNNDETTNSDPNTQRDDASSANNNNSVAADSQDHLRQKYRDVIPLIDRFGRVLTDFSSLLWSEIDTYRPPAPANSLFGNAASQFSANSFEARLLNLLRERPQSPPPERAYQTPIHGIFRPTGSTGQAGLDRHLDIHIAILSPPNAASGSSSGPVPLAAVNSTSIANSSTTTSASTTAAASAVAASLLVSPLATVNDSGSSEAMVSSASLSRSVADLTNSLQQQAQQLARRTQELTERTSAVTEITHTLGEMLRSRREHLESLQQEQRQLQQQQSSVDANNLPISQVSQIQTDVNDDLSYDEDQLSFDSSSAHSRRSGHSVDGNNDASDEEEEDEDSRNERQFLEDLLLRDYVQGGDTEDVEDERLLDIEIDLLQHALHHRHHHNSHHHMHHREAHPLLEPQEVSGLIEHDQELVLASEELNDVDNVLNAAEIEDDGGIGDVIQDIMTQTEQEMTVKNASSSPEKVGENEGNDDKESSVVLEDLDSGLSRAMAAVASTGTSLMPLSEDKIGNHDIAIDEGNRPSFHHQRHSIEQEPFFNLPNSRLVEDTDTYPFSPLEGYQEPCVDGSTLARLAEVANNDGSIVYSSAPESSSPIDNKPTLHMLAYGEDNNTIIGNNHPSQTDMPFVPHDNLVETDDFVEEHGAILPQEAEVEEEEEKVSSDANDVTVDSGEGATADRGDSSSPAQRRGSGMMMFQRLFSFRR